MIPMNLIMGGVFGLRHKKIAIKQKFFEFKRLGRKIKALEQRGMFIPPDMLTKHKELDSFLAVNNPKWRRNYHKEQQ